MALPPPVRHSGYTSARLPARQEKQTASEMFHRRPALRFPAVSRAPKKSWPFTEQIVKNLVYACEKEITGSE
jgi:hypothetical protein